MESPFPHHAPLAAADVRGRDELIADLVERISARRPTALIGPRRYGKTSVMKAVAHQIASPTVWIDLYELLSIEDLAIRIDTAMADADGPTDGALRRILAGVGVNVGVLKFDLARPGAPSATAALHARLDTLVDWAAEAAALIVIDEFAGITRVDGAAGLLRTKLQHRVHELGVLFAGSEPTTMRHLFAEREQPFYGQADLVQIDPLSLAAVTDIIAAGFEATGRRAGALARSVFGLTAGHPHRTMQVADAAWTATPPGSAWSDPMWADVVAAVRREVGEPSSTLYANLPAPWQRALRLLANGHPLYGTRAKALDLGDSSAGHARRQLVDAGHLHQVDAGWAIVDPLFADWIRAALPI